MHDSRQLTKRVLGNDRSGRRVPRVLMRREELWRLPIPGAPSEFGLLLDRRGALVTAGYTVYTDARTPAEFDDSVMQLLRGVSVARSRFFLGLSATTSTFHVTPLFRTVEQCRDMGVSTVVELRGSWSHSALALLATTRPDYLRVGPDLVRGIAHVPDQFRAVVALAEFARECGIPLVARGLDTTADLDSVRIAGIALLHRADDGADVDEALFASSTVSVQSPAVLDFPLRPFPTRG
jgi:hypothetical protein